MVLPGLRHGSQLRPLLGVWVVDLKAVGDLLLVPSSTNIDEPPGLHRCMAGADVQDVWFSLPQVCLCVETVKVTSRVTTIKRFPQIRRSSPGKHRQPGSLEVWAALSWRTRFSSKRCSSRCVWCSCRSTCKPAHCSRPLQLLCVPKNCN